MDDITLNDISDELLIVNKHTIDSLFSLDNCSDCIALYIFYYKTAKWQKTNIIKATDAYIKKSLNWGVDKIQRTKKILKEKGLINIVQKRDDGKISGWYVEVNYLINNKKEEEIKIKIDNSKNTYFQQLENSTTCNQETNALKEYIKCLKIEIEMLKNNKKENKKKKENEFFDKFWEVYPRKVDKKKAREKFAKIKPTEELVDTMIKQIERFKQTNDWQKENGKYIPHPSTWLNNNRWEDEIETEEEKEAKMLQRLKEKYGEE